MIANSPANHCRLSATAIFLIALLPAVSLASEATHPANLPNSLTLSADEKQVLDSVVDGTTQLDEAALYMMLAKVAEMPASQLSQIPSPTAMELLINPSQFRGQEMTMAVRVFLVTELRPGAGMTPSPWWTVGHGSIWRLDCTAIGPSEQAPQPVVIFSTVAPAMLGRPDQTKPNGRQIFASGPIIRATGVFYKTYKAQDRSGTGQGSQMRDYPVILSGQLLRGSTGLARKKPPTMTLVFVAVLGVGYVLLRRKIVRARPAAQATHLAEPPSQVNISAEDQDVDPELLEAVKKAQAERQTKPKG